MFMKNIVQAVAEKLQVLNPRNVCLWCCSVCLRFCTVSGVLQCVSVLSVCVCSVGLCVSVCPDETSYTRCDSSRWIQTQKNNSLTKCCGLLLYWSSSRVVWNLTALVKVSSLQQSSRGRHRSPCGPTLLPPTSHGVQKGWAGLQMGSKVSPLACGPPRLSLQSTPGLPEQVGLQESCVLGSGHGPGPGLHWLCGFAGLFWWRKPEDTCLQWLSLNSQSLQQVALVEAQKFTTKPPRKVAIVMETWGHHTDTFVPVL